MKDVISMCRSGGFNLIKFVSNSKELLQSIPEQQRRQGPKDKDLSGDLPTDKALGICWNVADDTFSFKIKLDRTSLTNVVNDKLHLRSTWFCSNICTGGEKDSAKSLQPEFSLGYGGK